MKLTKTFLENYQFKIAIFASGTGTNTLKIVEHFKKDKSVSVSLIVSNNAKAGVVDLATKNNIPVLIINKEILNDDSLIRLLSEKQIQLIVLAGFLLKIPSSLVNAFNNRIINLHPALLPLYGGKGMYGNFVHKSVILNKDVKSGISIHLVDEDYDHGKLLFQASCSISPLDTAECLAKKVQLLEHTHFINIITLYIRKYCIDQ